MSAHTPTPAGDRVRPLNIGFRSRLFGISVLLMIVFAVAIGVWVETSLRPLLEQQAISELEDSVVLVRASLKEKTQRTSADLTAELRALSGSTDMRITLIAPDGVVHADSSVPADALDQLSWHGDRPEVRAAHETNAVGVSRRYSRTLDEDMVYVALPIAWDDDQHGTIRVARTTTRADAPIFGLYQVICIALISGFGAALCVTWLAATSMDRDLQILLHHTNSLARGEPVVPLKLQSSVILAGIAGTVDQMAHETQRVLRTLADERRRSTVVLEAVRDGLLSIDRENRLTLVNPAGCTALGLKTEDLGRRLEKALQHTELLGLVQRARVEGEVIGDIVMSGSPDTKDQVFQVHVTPGENDGLVIALSDITQLRRLETIRRDFVANVSHEVRTPISIVQASAEALQDGAIQDPRYSAQFLDAILRNTDRLTVLTKDILQLSRIEAGQSMLDLTPVSVSDVVINVIEILHQRIRVRKQRVISTIESHVAIVADAGALEQVLVNLLENAMKYTPKKGNIRVSAAIGTQDRLRILVADNGPGIPAPHRSRIFERFYRVDPGRSREVGGTGLGLAIVKHLVESMDGAVGVEPNQPEGSIFWFELPIAPEQETEELDPDSVRPTGASYAPDQTG